MIRLEKMKADEFQRYLEFAIKNYAAEHVKAGNWDESDALSRAAWEYEKLLPEGEKTGNHHLFMIRDEEQEVGMIWLAQRSADKGFIYDIHIWEDYQGLGYGKQAMMEMEYVAKNLGLKSVGLHVFGHNQQARHLYEKLGYIETSVIMEKKI